MAACGAAASRTFCHRRSVSRHLALSRYIPSPGRPASVARPRDAPTSGTGGRAPLPFRRGKAHPRDREGHARLVALTDHAVDGQSRTTTRRRTSRSCRCSRRTTTSPPRWRRSIKPLVSSSASDGDTCQGGRGACVCVPRVCRLVTLHLPHLPHSGAPLALRTVAVAWAVERGRARATVSARDLEYAGGRREREQ